LIASKKTDMKKILILLGICSLMACSKKTLTSKVMSDKDYVFKKYQKAMVKYFKRDGCDYVIQLESGENLEPNVLTEPFQKDSLKVWVKYDIRKNAASICMMGKMVNVRDIKIRK
jgi:hypothetical protein